MPTSVAFHTKPKIALDQICAAHAAEIPKGVVLMAADHGADTALRGIQPHTRVWARGCRAIAAQAMVPATGGRSR